MPILLKKAVRVAIVCTLGLPLTTALAWQLFLALFAPPKGVNACPPIDEPAAVSSARHLVKSMSNHKRFDDAGCECSVDELQSVELRVEADGMNYIGHAFIHTPMMTCGFLTDDMDLGLVDYLWPLCRTVPGHIRDDRDHTYNYVISYKACPATLHALEASIMRHANDPYQVGNWRGGRNCATWARARLSDARLPSPTGDCPNKLAWSMTPRAVHIGPKPTQRTETAWARSAVNR